MGADLQSLRDSEKAFKTTLVNLYRNGFVDQETGLPFDTFDWNHFRRAAESISGGDVCEMFTPYWAYLLATGDGRIRGIVNKVMDSYITYLDPGTGFVGNYAYDTVTNQLSPSMNTKISEENAATDSRGRLLVDAEHGAEGPLYAVFPTAWYFQSRKAVRSLERYAENFVRLNEDPGFVHFHMYYGNAGDTWQVADWSGCPGYRFDSSMWGEPSTDAYADLMEFWWVLPSLGCAVVTSNQNLRERIIQRVALAMDNILEEQSEDGCVDFVYRMDGSFSNYSGGYATLPGIYSYQNWARACYFMDFLTGEGEYVDSLGRYLRWYVSSGPREYPDLLMSFLVFHYYYTGDEEYLRLAKDVYSSLAGGTASGPEVQAVCGAILYSATGDASQLEDTLKVERSLREANYRKIKGRRYYLLESELESTPVNGLSKWEVDNFRGVVAGVFFCAERGTEARGLVDRNLLLLGWLLDRELLTEQERGLYQYLLIGTGLLGVVLVGLYLRRRLSVPSSAPVKRSMKMAKEEDCRGFESLEKCYRCRFFAISRGRQYCTKHRIELEGNMGR